MADENTFEKIHVVRGKIQADQIVRYLHDNNIPSYCRGAGGLFETGRARFTQGYNIFTARKNADAARQLIRITFRKKFRGSRHIPETRPNTCCGDTYGSLP